MSRRNRTSTPMSLFSFQDIITATTGILILLALVLALSVIVQGAESTVEITHADDQLVAYRDDLAAKIKRMKALAFVQEKESATWSSLNIGEMKTKIESATTKDSRLSREIQFLETAIDNQKKQFKALNSNSKISDLSGKLKSETASIEELAKQIEELREKNRVVYNFRDRSQVAWLVEISGKSILAAKVGAKDKPVSCRSAYEFNKFAMSLPKLEQYFVLALKPSGIGNYEIIKPFLVQKGTDVGMELIAENQVVVDPVTGASF